MNDFTHIDLFSGIGGFSLAAESCGFKTVLFCEIDGFCQKVLKKHWPKTPIIPDIRDIDGTQWRGATLLTGGFPCQPFSVAGQRRGKEDDRHLWPEMLRVIKESRPRWICGENVAGIVRMELDQVLADLEDSGYSTQAIIIPACAKNAPHRRDRVWIIAHSRRVGQEEQKQQTARRKQSNSHAPHSQRRESREPPEQERGKDFSGGNSDAADSPTQRLPESQESQFGESLFYAERRNSENQTTKNPNGINAQRIRKERNSQESLGLPNGEDKAWEENWLAVATSLCRVDDGLPSWIYSDRIKRLKALGNAIVPQVAKEIIKGIYEIEEKTKKGGAME